MIASLRHLNGRIYCVKTVYEAIREIRKWNEVKITIYARLSSRVAVVAEQLGV